ncbi:hypothetical protein [Streptococcus oricebi]|uniref:Elongation factor Tu n=1 Tax=Streptococcus oricebi TaxID=1547447 RepID=A0ABS5B0R3_9STRE|nr:hypothetical protein [Streptococcus oricebi]MBP2622417.1 hypothetical protein [Streptococcus oricebi]
MEYLIASNDQEEFTAYQAFIGRARPQVEKYIKKLEEDYRLIELPKGLVLANVHQATEVLSQKSIAAYTNAHFITLTPDVTYWKELFLRTVEGVEHHLVDEFYQDYSEIDVLQVLGHELAHHSDLFLDDFEDNRTAMWFEEGMVEYLSAKMLLPPKRFEQKLALERYLVDNLKDKYGRAGLESFTVETYQESIQAIFYQYWRSFVTVKDLVEQYGNNPLAVFEVYHDWFYSEKAVHFSTYLGLN